MSPLERRVTMSTECTDTKAEGQLQPTDAVNQISIFSSGQAFVTQLDVVTIATEFILRWVATSTHVEQ